MHRTQRHKLLAFALVALAVIFLATPFAARRLFPSQVEELKARLDQQLPAGIERGNVANWLTDSTIQYYAVDGVKDTIGKATVYELAQIDEARIGSVIRAKVVEKRFFGPHQLTIYFFFDHDDRLIKKWEYEDDISF
jgi:hypothetical protein